MTAPEYILSPLCKLNAKKKKKTGRNALSTNFPWSTSTRWKKKAFKLISVFKTFYT